MSKGRDADSEFLKREPSLTSSCPYFVKVYIGMYVYKDFMNILGNIIDI